MVPVGGFTPNYHDILTGSTPDGRAFPANINITCNNWTSSNAGKAMLGHVDRRGLTDTEQARSSNSTHQARDCSQEGLLATGGNGLFYCFRYLQLELACAIGLVDDAIDRACAVQFSEESMQLPDGFFVWGDDREDGHRRS